MKQICSECGKVYNGVCWLGGPRNWQHEAEKKNCPFWPHSRDDVDDDASVAQRQSRAF